jgi:hypothetical protein
VEGGEDESRAARTERTPFRRNPVRPTVPPPSVHMVRPVRNSFYFLLSYSLLYVQEFLSKFINQSIFIIIAQMDLIPFEFLVFLFSFLLFFFLEYRWVFSFF